MNMRAKKEAEIVWGECGGAITGFDCTIYPRVLAVM